MIDHVIKILCTQPQHNSYVPENIMMKVSTIEVFRSYGKNSIGVLRSLMNPEKPRKILNFI